MMNPSRREVLAGGVAGTAGLLGFKTRTTDMQDPSTETKPFQLKYAPHFGMFQNLAGSDLVDQLKFAADHGFRAWEDNGMMGRSVTDQEKLGQTMRDLGIEMGVFVADAEWGKP